MENGKIINQTNRLLTDFAEKARPFFNQKKYKGEFGVYYTYFKDKYKGIFHSEYHFPFLKPEIIFDKELEKSFVSVASCIPSQGYPYYFSFLYQFDSKNHLVLDLGTFPDQKQQTTELVFSGRLMSFDDFELFYSGLFDKIREYKKDYPEDGERLGYGFAS